MEKTVVCSDIEVTLKASAAMIYKYRDMYNRDIIVDFNKIASGKSEEAISILSDVSYMMAKLGNKELEMTQEEWLDQFDFTEFYQVIIPAAFNLWKGNNERKSKPKK